MTRIILAALLLAGCTSIPTAPDSVQQVFSIPATETTNYWVIKPTWEEARNSDTYPVEMDQGRIVAENNGTNYLLAWTVMRFPEPDMQPGAQLVSASLTLHTELVKSLDTTGEVRFLQDGRVVGRLPFFGTAIGTVYTIPLEGLDPRGDITVDARSSFDLDGVAPRRLNFIRFTPGPMLRIVTR